jgi:hypothetical protein
MQLNAPMTELNSWQHLAAADIASVETPSPFMLHAGLAPAWSRWREGCYAERPIAFASLWQTFTEWRTSQLEQKTKSIKHLPVFWIEGRPGDGKSVLLLQLMAACLRERLASSVLWAEHSPDGRLFGMTPPQYSGWFFSDEIPTRVEGSIRDDWMSGLRNAGAAALFATGSAEVRHGFEFRFEKQIQVTKWALPLFSPLETAQFAAWFQARAGISRDPAALWREGMSLTEFLFSLHHGKPLAELTSDIRGALGNLGLGGRVRAVWLANALGLHAPATLLATDAARNHAAKLTERGVVPVEISAAGLRLVPPALAWPMVGAWLGEGHQMQHLADALAFVLKSWLDAGNEEKAGRFLRQLRETEWLTDEKPFGNCNSFVHLKRREVVRELYRAHRRDFGGQPAPATVPAWLELNETFSLMLLPDPVACAAQIFSKPENESRRTPLLAALVWLGADSRRAPLGNDARKAVADYFLSPMTEPGAGRALMRIVRDTKKLAEARTLAEVWLKLLPGHSEAMDVLGSLVKRAGGGAEFMAWAMEHFIQPIDSHPCAPQLLMAMLEGSSHAETVRRRAAAWAWCHAVQPEAGIFWLTLLSGTLAKEDIVRGALSWLAANPAHRGADVMRERLLANYPEAHGAAWILQEWLPHHSADERSPDFLLQLLQTQPNNRKISAPALEWLNHSLTHPSSPQLLRLLMKHPGHEIETIAERWFDANPNSSSHAELLSAFIRVLRGGAKWMTRGESYADDSQRPGREHVVASLLTANGCQLRHLRLALRLLPEIPIAARTFLETVLGRSLALHPLQAEKAVREFTGTVHIPDLARALSRGLAQIADMRVEFAKRVLPAMNGEAASLTLYHLVRADVRSPEIIAALLDWLREHYRERGYALLLGALNNHPTVWKCLMATGRLDRRVIADLRNFRPITPEHFAN